MIILYRSLGHVFAATLAVAILQFAAARARAEARDGTELVRAVGQAAFALLGDRSLNAPAREERLRALYREHFDGDGICAQVLGRAWRHATPAERRELADLVETYFAKLLATRLSEFSGSDFRVLLSEPDGDGVAVYSQLADQRQRKYLNIKWRLAKSGATYRIRDLVVENISVTLHQRREFAADIPEQGGNLAALKRALRNRIVKLERGT